MRLRDVASGYGCQISDVTSIDYRPARRRFPWVELVNSGEAEPSAPCREIMAEARRDRESRDATALLTNASLGVQKRTLSSREVARDDPGLAAAGLGEERF